MVSPKPRYQKHILILSLDVKNDFNLKPKYSKIFLPKANILKKILIFRPNAEVITCFDFCLNYVAYNLTLAQNKLILKNVFPSMAQGDFTFGPRTFGSWCLQDICFNVFLRL